MNMYRFIREIFPNYNEYHKNIDTGNLKRAMHIAEWIDIGSTVLDIGCGDGENARYIKEKRSAIVTGVDIVDKAKNIVEVIILDLNSELQVNQQYDYVIICEVLEHIIYPHKILLSAANIARRGVIVAIINSGYIFFRIQLLFGIFPRQSYTHLHYWTLKDFEIFCKQLNIEIIKVKYNNTSYTKSIAKKIFPNLFAYQLYFYIKPKRF